MGCVITQLCMKHLSFTTRFCEQYMVALTGVTSKWMFNSLFTKNIVCSINALFCCVHAQHCRFKFTTSTDFFGFEFVNFNIITSLHIYNVLLWCLTFH